MWKVQIIEYETEKVVKEFLYLSEHLANKADRNINHNLDTENYFTVVIQE